jgi:hypothetical protein
MNIGTFQIFCDLVETTSFSEAGRRNGGSQSAVSQRTILFYPAEGQQKEREIRP